MHPRLFPPTHSAVSEQGKLACGGSRTELCPAQVVFASPQKLVPFDCRNHSDRTFFARFGPLHAAQSNAYLYWPGHGDLIGQRQQDLNRRPFFDVLGEEEIDSTLSLHRGGFKGAGFTYCSLRLSCTAPVSGNRMEKR